MDQNQIYIIGIVVFGVISGLIAILHFKKQGKLTEELVEVVEEKTKEAIEIARDFLSVIDLGDGVEKTVNTVLNVTHDAVVYVSSTIDPKTDKKQSSIDVVNAILGELKIDASEEHKKLIKLVVENSVRQLDKKRL